MTPYPIALKALCARLACSILSRCRVNQLSTDLIAGTFKLYCWDLFLVGLFAALPLLLASPTIQSRWGWVSWCLPGTWNLLPQPW